MFQTKSVKKHPVAENFKSNGIGFSAVPALQRLQADEELVQSKSIAQLAAPEEELQLRADPMQRQVEEEEPVQGRFVLQRVGLPEEEESVQGRFNPVQLMTAEHNRPNNTGIPDNLKSGIENMSGFSMDNVKVHYNSSQPAQLNALAYAQGNDIHVGPGQEKHLPHEAWHVVQQRQGRVKPTLQMKEGVAVNDDPGLEKEADVMGAQAMQHKPMYRKGH